MILVRAGGSLEWCRPPDYLPAMRRTWEQYVHLAMFAVATAVIVAVMVW